MRSALWKLSGKSLIFLMILPLMAWSVAEWGFWQTDKRVQKRAYSYFDSHLSMTAEEKARQKALWAEVPSSSTWCSSQSPEIKDLRGNACNAGEELWQFETARRVSIGLLMAGVLAMALVWGLGLLAWAKPRTQYAVLVFGRWFLIAFVSLEELVLGALAVWLSYWITGLAFDVYVPQIIGVVALLALMGIASSLKAIFSFRASIPEVQGELILPEESPLLWRRLESLAKDVGTPPPSTVVAGIDDNFFVTESPTHVEGRKVTGRLLYVSLPLLRLLSAKEADAVMAHELAHFRDGDTRASARLGPALNRFDNYLNRLEGLFAQPALFLMELFRKVFELARMQESRDRELAADATAARVTSGNDLAGALLKIAAYSSHRTFQEGEQFSRNQLQAVEALNFRLRLTESLERYTQGEAFQSDLTALRTPHPFDSHPPLMDRLEKVGSTLHPQDCPALFARAPLDTWAQLIENAEALENEQWAEYEAQFLESHEQSLAYRYLPSTPDETALVEKYFPEKHFALAKGGAHRLTYGFLELEDGPRYALHEITNAQHEQGDFEDLLSFHHEPANETPQRVTVNLKALEQTERESFKQLFSLYWSRTQTAHEYQASVATFRTEELGAASLA